MGAGLVAAHCTDPDALSSTLGVVDSYLVLYCGGNGPVELSTEDSRARCARIQHALMRRLHPGTA